VSLKNIINICHWSLARIKNTKTSILDAWFLSTTATTAKYTSDDLRLTYPNRAGAINSIQNILSEKDEINLLAEVDDYTLAKKLLDSHELTRKIFSSSNVRVQAIISLQITIEKIPYYWSEESDDFE
jgi:hypothetical protein